MIPEEVSLASELQERLRFETLLSDLSSKFINLPSGKVDREIEDSQRRVCECLGFDLSTLWQWSEQDPHLLILTHFYRPLGGPPVPSRMDGREFFPWSQEQTVAGRTITITSVKELPAEAARDLEVYHHFGVKSALTIPLSAGGGPVFGAVSFNTMLAERSWPEALVQRLHMIAQIFANALARQHMDEVLRESEEQLNLAAESAGVGLWSLNLETGRFWITDIARQLFGFPSDEAMSFDRFLELVHPDDRDLVRQVEQTLVQSGEQGRVDYRIIRGDGSLRWMSSRARIRRANSGAPDRLMGVTLDITDRKLAEEELRRLRAQLWHADRVAQTGAIAVSLAHELSQPLSAMLNNAQAGLRFLSAEKPDLEEIRGILTDIIDDDRRAAGVIAGLREMLHLKEAHRERINLADAVQGMLALLKSELQGQQVELSLCLQSDSPVLADKVQVQQVILNLVMNAVEAMRSSPPDRRRLELVLTQSGDGEALVSVRDTGPGISEEQRDKVFEPFWSTKQEGMGIGLTISRSIVESYAGSLWFENNQDQGTTFYFTLPLHAGD